MKELCQARKVYGNTFVTLIQEDKYTVAIPWQPLSIQDYIDYTHAFTRDLIPIGIIENEIFIKCVSDQTYVQQIDTLKAGVITTVVSNILEYSAPQGIDSFNNDLDLARSLLNEDGIGIIHQFVSYITDAFPYKPEEVYAMNYETFLFRAVQAEAKLMKAGILQEPIKVYKAEEEEKKEVKRPNIDVKKLWESKFQNKPTPRQPPTNHKKKKWWKVSPILEATEKSNIDFEGERVAQDSTHLDNHDLSEPPEVKEFLAQQKTKDSRAKMVEDARWIYKDVIEALNQKKRK